jgi:prepilin-type N-terminal cleavage/methylation domain-containing protein
MNLKNIKKTHNKGFTLVELLLSMAIFTFMLTIALSGLFGVLRVYRNAYIARELQTDAKKALETMSRDIRVARLIPRPNPDVEEKYREVGHNLNEQGIQKSDKSLVPGQSLYDQNLGKNTRDKETIYKTNGSTKNMLCLDTGSVGADIVYRVELVYPEGDNKLQPTTVIARYESVLKCNPDTVGSTGSSPKRSVITSARYRVYDLDFEHIIGLSRDGVLPQESIVTMLEMRQRRLPLAGDRVSEFENRVLYTTATNLRSF